MKLSTKSKHFSVDKFQCHFSDFLFLSVFICYVLNYFFPQNPTRVYINCYSMCPEELEN